MRGCCLGLILIIAMLLLAAFVGKIPSASLPKTGDLGAYFLGAAVILGLINGIGYWFSSGADPDITIIPIFIAGLFVGRLGTIAAVLAFIGTVLLWFH